MERRLKKEERAALERAKADLPLVHPACAIMPLMSDAELAGLAVSIRDGGLLHPIVMFEGQVLDGKCRWIACRIAGVEPRLVRWVPQGDDNPWLYVLRANIDRAHYTKDQRAALVVEWQYMREQQASTAGGTEARVRQGSEQVGDAADGSDADQRVQSKEQVR